MTASVLPTGQRLAVPGVGSVRAGVARSLVRLAAGSVPVTVVEHGGDTFGGGAAGGPVLELVDPGAVYRRIADHPKIGLGEAYMAGEWRAGDGTDLAEVLAPFAQRLGSILPGPLLRLRRLVDRAMPDHERNTLTGARANIAAHYDLSNDLFAAFLDETMAYSSALFDETRPWAEQSLAAAQDRKVDAVLDAAGVGAGTRLLEIGTGWGGLALRAAARGASVTTVTLSAEQRVLARRRVADAGLADLVDVRLEDYREVSGRFDAVVSVEMVEAVGEEYWPDYVEALARLVDDDGTVVLQSILMGHDRFLATRRSYGWIQKHIFPGGLIPSLPAFRAVTESHTDLRVVGVRSFGPHYAETLRRWRLRFLTAWPDVAPLGFDDTFRRTWEFYLAYCEAGFATGYLDVAHLTLRHDPARSATHRSPH